jgi:hypothetical protein
MTQRGFSMMLVAIGACWLFASAAPLRQDFSKSLHATRAGKGFWYGAASGGFEKLTGVPIEDLGCKACHGPTDSDGNAYAAPYPGAGCVDCHRSEDQAIAESQCLGCHGRQKTESVLLQLGDVHRSAGMQCWDCHGSEDVHGDGTEYRSLLEVGAIRASCDGCHPATDLPAEHGDHDPHEGALHCTACHVESVVSCYNCHFESQVRAGVKRANRPIDGFVMLVNREKDGKVHPATFQSLTYGGKAFVAFAPYAAHTVSKRGRTCGECHVGESYEGKNAAIAQYNAEGVIRFAEWDANDHTLRWMRGVVPIPEDYRETLRMDFLTFGGDPATPAGEGKANWAPIGKDRWDGSQMLFARPLSREQMNKLGFAEPGSTATTGKDPDPGD